MNEQPEECNSCGFETEELEYYNHSERWLCNICASTHLSNENMDRENILLAKSIAYLGNMILQAIKDSKNCPYCGLTMTHCQCKKVN